MYTLKKTSNYMQYANSKSVEIRKINEIVEARQKALQEATLILQNLKVSKQDPCMLITQLWDITQKTLDEDDYYHSILKENQKEYYKNLTLALTNKFEDAREIAYNAVIQRIPMNIKYIRTIR